MTLKLTFSKILFSALLLAGLVAVAPASAQVSPQQQMFLMKELKPDAAKVGIIWKAGVANREELLLQIQRSATSTGIKVFVSEVKDLKDVAEQYRNLVRTHGIQMLWIVENDGVVNDAASRKFLIKSAMEARIMLVAPSNDWVNEGACVAIKKQDDAIGLVVNKAAAEALSISVPEKYRERTQFLAMN